MHLLSLYLRNTLVVTVECFPEILLRMVFIGSCRVWKLVVYTSFNPLKPGGEYTYHLLHQSVTLHFVFIGFVWFSL
jgi:hypothetical protein